MPRPPKPIRDFPSRASCAFVLALLSPGAADPGPEKAFGFDGIDGYAGPFYERFDRTNPASEWGAFGALNAQFHARRVELRAGLGGVLNLSPFGDGEESFGGAQYRTFGVYFRELNLRIRFGPPGSPEGMQAGIFPLRTNPDAALFGNYLARYGAYTIGLEQKLNAWDSLGAVDPMAQGIRIAYGLPGAALRSEAAAIHDVGVLSFKGFLAGTALPGLEWGAGLDFHRWYRFDSGSDRTRRNSNGYVKTDTGYIPLRVAARDTVPRPREDTGYWFEAAVRLSARAAVDFGALTGGDGRGWKDGAVFAEAALLGWENQPILYEDRMRRFVWTVGARLPSFGWLDGFTLQYEWLPSAYRPSDHAKASGWVGTEFMPADTGSSWSAGLLVSRNLGKRFAVQGRVLSEPVRTDDPYRYRFVFPDPITRHPPSRQVRTHLRAFYRLP